MIRNEQWKLQGDCHKCRKEHYCRKECRTRKLYKHLNNRSTSEQVLDNLMGGAYTGIQRILEKFCK